MSIKFFPRSTAVVIAAALSLSACGTVAQKAPPPVVDLQSMPVHQLVNYQKDLKTCRGIQEAAMPVSFLEAFGSSDVRADERRREEKASAIVRECLKSRGYAVLY